MSYDPLRAAMLEVAPRVEELTGLRIPRRHNHLVHPRIRWVTDDWHLEYFGFYRSLKPKTIYVNAHHVVNFVKGPEMTRAVIAHEYTHYLQDLHWPWKKWNDNYELEKLAYEVEMNFVPEGYKFDIEEALAARDLKRRS